MMNEFSKTCFTILFSFIVLYIIELLLKVPEEYEKKLSEAIENGNIKNIKIKQ